MSRYTLKPHGLRIGSDNLFHLFEGEVILDFNAILTFEGFRFGDATPFSTAHVKVLTPAIQLCWETVRLPFPVTEGFDKWRTHFRPQPWFHRWLDENAPGWAISQPKADMPSDRTIFLQKRSHALAIADLVAKYLGAIPSDVGLKRPKKAAKR